MATSWRIAGCILLTSLCICCAIHPLQQQQQQRQQRMEKQQQTEDSTRTIITPSEGHVAELKTNPGKERVKREAADCPVFEAQAGQGLQEILDTDGEAHSFFIQPQQGFNRLVFRMKVNNKFDLGSSKYAEETLDISSSRLGVDWAHPTWIPVEVKYFKREKIFGRDRHALRVKVGKNLSEELITRWWRTHSYEGFTVYAEGPLKVLKCNSKNAVAEFVVSGGEEKQILLIVCVLGICFFLVVGAAILYFLIAGRCRTPTRDDPPPVPKLPKSLFPARRVNRNRESDHIYEKIDEGTLAKLRQNFDSETLGRPQDVKDRYGGSTETINIGAKPFLDLASREHCHFSEIPFGDTSGLSLLEEKEAQRQCSGLDSPLESHYVEMHGIVSRTSSLNK